MIKQLKTVDEYDNFTKQKSLVIIHIWADWNAHDRTMQRTLIELEPEFPEKLKIGAIDFDNNATFAILQKLNILNVPALIYFFDGEQIAAQTGLRPMDEIRHKILSLLQPQ